MAFWVFGVLGIFFLGFMVHCTLPDREEAFPLRARFFIKGEGEGVKVGLNGRELENRDGWAFFHEGSWENYCGWDLEVVRVVVVM